YSSRLKIRNCRTSTCSLREIKNTRSASWTPLDVASSFTTASALFDISRTSSKIGRSSMWRLVPLVKPKAVTLEDSDNLKLLVRNLTEGIYIKTDPGALL